MILLIDTTAGRVSVAEGADCKRLAARVSGNGDLSRALAGFATADAAGTHLWVEITALRAAAQPADAPDWAASYDGMIRYAASKGWCDADGTRVRVHLEPAA